MRVIVPKKNPKNGCLRRDDEIENHKVPLDPMIVEIFFGHVCETWAFLSSKWRWNEDFYDTLFRLCKALTNVHILHHPFRAEDRNQYVRFNNRLCSVGDETRKRRQRVQLLYRQKRGRRVNMQFRGLELADGEDGSCSA